MSASTQQPKYNPKHPKLRVVVSAPNDSRTISLPSAVDKMRRQPDPLKR
jgi:hypothetical protein